MLIWTRVSFSLLLDLLQVTFIRSTAITLTNILLPNIQTEDNRNIEHIKLTDPFVTQMYASILKKAKCSIVEEDNTRKKFARSAYKWCFLS